MAHPGEVTTNMSGIRDRITGRFGALVPRTRVDANVEAQTDLLAEAGCEKVFIDKVSGKLARRPRWDACLDYMRPGDQLVVTRLSRVARSVQHLTEVVAELERHDVDLVVLKQGPELELAAAVSAAEGRGPRSSS